MADGRPLYCAAPSTTIASAWPASSRLPTSQIRNVIQPDAIKVPAIPTSASVAIRRITGVDLARRDAGQQPSAAVALLVLLAGPAPTGVVPPDPGTARREAGLGLAGRRAAAIAPGFD